MGLLSRLLRKPPAGLAPAMPTPDLPMDEVSRLARARAQGFDMDTPLYHGRRRDTEDIYSSPQGWFGPGVYTSKAPERASWYAQKRWHGGDHEGGHVVPLRARGKIATLEEYEALERRFRPNRRYKTGDDERLAARVQAELKRRGFTGVYGRGADDEVLIFDAANVRSPFARFDPAMSGSSNILAGASGLIGAGLLSRAQRQPQA